MFSTYKRNPQNLNYPSRAKLIKLARCHFRQLCQNMPFYKATMSNCALCTQTAASVRSGWLGNGQGPTCSSHLVLGRFQNALRASVPYDAQSMKNNDLPMVISQNLCEVSTNPQVLQDNITKVYNNFSQFF